MLRGLRALLLRIEKWMEGVPLMETVRADDDVDAQAIRRNAKWVLREEVEVEWIGVPGREWQISSGADCHGDKHILRIPEQSFLAFFEGIKTVDPNQER